MRVKVNKSLNPSLSNVLSTRLPRSHHHHSLCLSKEMELSYLCPTMPTERLGIISHCQRPNSFVSIVPQFECPRSQPVSQSLSFFPSFFLRSKRQRSLQGIQMNEIERRITRRKRRSRRRTRRSRIERHEPADSNA